MKTYRIPQFRVQLVRDGSLQVARKICDNSIVAAEILREHLNLADRECFAVIALNNRNQAIGVHTASMGTLGHCLFSPREILKFAFLMNASAIIVGHNHPSGDPTPSGDDRKATEKLKIACDAVGVPLVDHVVVSEDSHCSFADKGWL